jgi:serine protease
MSVMTRLPEKSRLVRARTFLAAGTVLLLTAASAAIAGTGAAAAAPAPTASPVTSAEAAHPATAQLTAVASLAGVVRPRGAASAPSRATGTTGTGATAARSAAAAAASGCVEPACNLPYHGGPVQHAPRVYVIFWGPRWSSDALAKPAERYLLAYFKGLGAAPDTWSLDAAQYSDSSGHPTFGRPLYGGAHVDTSVPPKTVTVNDLGREADKAVGYFKLTDVNNAQVVIADQSGTCFAKTSLGQFDGNCGVQQKITSNTTGYCAYHTFDYNTGNPHVFLPWINLPFQLDAGTDCGKDFVTKTGTYDGFSVVAGHESMETAADPQENAWIDLADGISGGELADKCAWGGAGLGYQVPFGLLALTTGKFGVQSLWSNAAGKCVMSGKLAISISPLPTQHSLLGKQVSLRMRVTSNGRTALTFSAAGLPYWLSIGKHTGVITGVLGVTAGTFRPTITVHYYGGWVSVKFPWQISSSPGKITGYGGKCVDDYHGHANGKIDLWTCDGTTRQQLTFTAGGQLQLLGQCVTAYATALLKPCTAVPSQQWKRLTDGEYSVKSTGTCLTDPGNSTANGTQLTLTPCRDTPNQRWSLP